MEWLYPVLQAVQVISALTVIGLVLLQHGRGADMGSAFGAGSSGSVFGAAGAANFLSRATRWAAIIFFVATAGLAWAVSNPKQQERSEEHTYELQLRWHMQCRLLLVNINGYLSALLH